MYMHIYASNCSEDSFVSDLNEFMNLTQRLGGWDIWRLRKFSVFFSTFDWFFMFDPMLCLWVHSLSVDFHTTLMLMILHLFVHGLSEKPGPSIRTVPSPISCLGDKVNPFLAKMADFEDDNEVWSLQYFNI